jgi:hypothetical protein
MSRNNTRDRLKRLVESRKPMPPMPVVEHKYANCSLCTREIDITANEFYDFPVIDCEICRVAANGVGAKRIYCSETCKNKDRIVYHHYKCQRPAILFKARAAPCDWGNGIIKNNPIGSKLWIPGYKFHPPVVNGAATVVNGAATIPFNERRAVVEARLMSAQFSAMGSCACNNNRMSLTAAHNITVYWPHLPRGENKTTFTNCCPVDLSALLISFVNNITNTLDCPEEMQMKIRAACSETLILIALLSNDRYTAIGYVTNNCDAYNVLNDIIAELNSNDTLAAIAVDSVGDEDVVELATMASKAAIFRRNMREEYWSETSILDDYRVPSETSHNLWSLLSETFKLMLKVEEKGRFKGWSPNTYATLFACTYQCMLKFAWADVRKQHSRLDQTGRPIVDARCMKACIKKMIDVSAPISDLCGYYSVVSKNASAYILEHGYSDVKDLPQAGKYLDEILELDTVDNPVKLATRKQFMGKFAIEFRTARKRLAEIRVKLADDFESLDNVEVD